MAVICGFSEYETRADYLRFMRGEVSKDALDGPRCYPAVRGHWFEKAIQRIYAVAMRCAIGDSGISIHPKYSFVHASPDGLSVQCTAANNVPPHPPHRHTRVAHSHCTARDSLAGLIEIKARVGSAHQAAAADAAVAHHVPLCYMTQLQSQMACLNAPWVDFVSSWFHNASVPAKPVADGTAWVVGEVFISRVYHSPSFCAAMYRAVASFRAAALRAEARDAAAAAAPAPPPHHAYGAVRMAPLKRLTFVCAPP